MGTVIRHIACPECRAKGLDTKGNNLAVYDDNSAYCFACSFVIVSKDYSKRNTKEESDLEKTIEKITEEQNKRIKDNTCYVDYRGIRKDTAKFFGVRYELDEESGEVLKQYYPITMKGELVGYKVRKHPKEFIAPVGYVGKNADFFGQFRASTGDRDLLLVGGELDMLSAYQMLRDSQIARGKSNYEPITVISSVIGESATASQAKLQYQFLNRFKRIILCLDNDEAGEEATEKLVKILPKGKVFLMDMRKKDPNEYLQAGMEREFVNDFYKARLWTPAGLYSSDALYNAAIDYVSMDRLPLPKFMSKANRMLGGGIPKGYITIIAAASSVGKSTLINQICCDWIMESKEKIGIMSLEASAGEYATNLISYYTKTKLASIEDKQQRIDYLNREDVQSAAKDLFVGEDGSPRFVLCDDRGDSIEAMEEKMEEMVKSMGITCLVIDVTSDLLSGIDLARQEQHMAWQKKFVKETNIIICNVFHIRKASGSQQAGSRGAEVTDESLMGTSTSYKSAGIIFGLVRDKMAEDDLERNTTKVRILKNRSNGITGAAGELLYLQDEHRLVDKEDWLTNNSLGNF